MKLARTFGLLVCVALAWNAADTPAQAQTFGLYGAGGFAGPGFWGYRASPYSLGQIPVPPYFSLHPPVYYSAPVPRSYGYSPFAYPGTMRTPDVVMAPEVIENPHATKQPAMQKVDSKDKVVRAQLIVNPYATSNNSQFVAAD